MLTVSYVTHTHTHTDITQGSTYTGCGLYIVMEQLADRHQTYIGDGNNMLRHTCGVKVMVGGGRGLSARWRCGLTVFAAVLMA